MNLSLYALLMILSLAGPLALSFDKKVAFYKSWWALFPGILINALLFILWDGWFVREGVWSFNPEFVWSFRVNDLPLEEWSFFFVIPYCSVFIYACLKGYFSSTFLDGVSHLLTLSAFLITGALLVLNYNLTYTFYNSLFAFLILGYHVFGGKKSYMGYFWLAYFIHLLPFGIINGILTAKPVVIYNNAENLGIRLGTIPIEDTIYALTCLLLPITVMEFLLQRKKTPAPISS
jgi:lycopene cyclase domain-containing protein